MAYKFGFKHFRANAKGEHMISDVIREGAVTAEVLLFLEQRLEKDPPSHCPYHCHPHRLPLGTA